MSILRWLWQQFCPHKPVTIHRGALNMTVCVRCGKILKAWMDK